MGNSKKKTSGKETQLAFRLDKCFLAIQKTEEGYDYSIIGINYRITDGGVYDDPGISIREALDIIMEDVPDSDTLVPIDYNSLMEEVEAAERISILEASAGAAVRKFRDYAEVYRTPPYGREVTGTPELFENAAWYLEGAVDSLSKMRQRYMDGIKVHYQGDDADDGIECPVCGWVVATNDDYDGMKPKHCPECGTKLLY